MRLMRAKLDATSHALATALAVAIALAAGVAVAGEPKTLLGKWMKPNMGAPLAGQDFDKLKASFDVVAGKPPPGDYPQWASMSAVGAKASTAKDVPAIKAACKQCHDAYKTKYENEFPTRPFP
jgi:cytochrome c553